MAVHSGSLERLVRAMAILLIMAGDVEQNPGPLPPSPESMALRYHFASLVTAITDPLMLSLKLYSEGIIEQTAKDKASILVMTATEKSNVLLSAVTSKVNTDPRFFHQFVDLLKSEGDDSLKSLGEKLEDTYNEITKEDTERHTLNPPPTKRQKLSPSHIREQVSQPHSQPQPSLSLAQPSQPQSSHSLIQPSPHPQLTRGAEHVNELPTVKPGMNPSRVKQPKTNHKERKNVSALPTVNPRIDPSGNKLPKTKDREREGISELPMGSTEVDQLGIATDHKDRDSVSEPSVVEPGVETEQLKTGGNVPLVEDTTLVKSSYASESSDFEEDNDFTEDDTEQCTLPPAKRLKLSPSLTPQPSQSHSQLTSHSCGEENVNEQHKLRKDPSQIETDHTKRENINALQMAEPEVDSSTIKSTTTDHKGRESISEPLTVKPEVDPSMIKLTTIDSKERVCVDQTSAVEPVVEDMETEQLKSSNDGSELLLAKCKEDTKSATSSHTGDSSDIEKCSESKETAFLMPLPGSKHFEGDLHVPEHVSLVTPNTLARYEAPGNVWLPVICKIRLAWLVITNPSVLEQRKFRLPHLLLPVKCASTSKITEVISMYQHYDNIFDDFESDSDHSVAISIDERVLFACMTRDLDKLTSFPQNLELLLLVCITGWLELLKTLVEQIPTEIMEDLDTLVYCACCSGNVNIVKYLVKKYNFSTHLLNPLRAACCRGSLDIVELLLDGKHCSLDSLDYNAPSFRGEYSATALHYASMFGHMDIVKYLISQYFTVTHHRRRAPTRTSSRNKGGRGMGRRKSKALTLKLDSNSNTPLHLAAGRGHMEIVKFLIAGKYFSVDSRNCYGNTPLFIACALGYTEIVKFLLTEGHCDTAFYTNKDFNTALFVSCQRGHTDIVKFLIDEEHCTADCENEFGSTPLLLSCVNGHTEIVKYLLTGGYCTADCVTRHSNTPLMVSCKNGHTEIVKFLLTENYCTTGEDYDASLWLACREGHTEVVEFLLTGKYCTVDCTDKNGNTPLHLACEGRNLEVVKFLITEQHALINCVNKEQNTPLHLVCRYKSCLNDCHTGRNLHSDQQDIVKLLVSNGLSPRTRGCNGNTTIHYACEQKLLEVVEYFFKHCDLSMYGTWTNNNGDTPLHLACTRMHASLHCGIISCLVKSGYIDPLAVNCQGKTAMDCIRNSNTQTNKAASILAYYHKNAKIHNSLEPAMKLFVLGNPRIGKTTLVRAIRVLNSLPPGMATFINVTGSEPTAGIDVVGFRDEQFGPVSVHDLAGQTEYYASHDALVQNLITSSVAVFVIVVKLADSDDIIKKSLQYWMSFIDNCCSRVQATGRVIIVGSWADEVPISAENFSCKWMDEMKSTDHVKVVGFVPLDCRQIELDGLNSFRKLVQESCEALKTTERTFSSHECAIYAFILEHLQDKVACTVNELADCISQSELNTTLPTEPNILSLFLSGLSDGGLLLYLPNRENVGAGWVILRREALLSDINGTIFAPENFKKHFEFNTSTGVVSERTLSQAFQEIDPHMIVQVMTHFEFCQKIEDPATVSLIGTSGHCSSVSESRYNSENYSSVGLPSEQYYFFPALVHTDYPEHLLDDVINEEHQKYQSGWCIKCATERQFFSPHFIYILLLRLAFSFALVPSTTYHQGSPVIRRHCTVWKNGIQWSNDDGTKALVEVIDQRQCVLVTRGEEDIDLIKQRSSIIAEILSIEREYCPNICTEESILDLTNFPSTTIGAIAKSIRQKDCKLIWFTVADIANAVSTQGSHVVSPRQMKIEKLVYFEPYVGLQKNVIKKLFEEEYAHVDIDDGFLQEFAITFKGSSKILAKMLSLPSSRQLDNPVDQYLHLLKTWKTNDSNKTFASLRSILDKHSIFCGRNPLVFPETEQKPKIGNPESTHTANTGPVQPSPATNYTPAISTSDTHHSQCMPNEDIFGCTQRDENVQEMFQELQLVCHSYGYLSEEEEVLPIEVTPTEFKAIQQLVSCGYSVAQATRAYFKCDEDVEAAKLWLIENFMKCTEKEQQSLV